METLSDYELADWLEDYVNQRNILGNPHIEDNENTENTITPWIKSIKSTVDKMSGKK